MTFALTTFINSRDNVGVEKVKWGHITWVFKGSQFIVLSLCPSKMISAVSNV